MLVAKNNFLVKVDSQFVPSPVKGFFVDTDFNPRLLATKIGTIHTGTIGITEGKYENKLVVGNTVVFGHNVCQNINRMAENVFRCPYHDIFAKIVHGKLQPLEGNIFCLPVKDPDKNLGGFVIPGKVSDKYAKVHALSAAAKKAGLKRGDIVFFTKDADYVVEVLGMRLYMMRLRNIIGIERDGELKTFRNKVLVKNVTKLGSIGGIDKIYAQTSLQHGVVLEPGVTGIEKGATLTYLNGPASIVKWKEENYAFIDERNIKFIL